MTAITLMVNVMIFVFMNNACILHVRLVVMCNNSMFWFNVKFLLLGLQRIPVFSIHIFDTLANKY